jgi:hypothetical protein
MEAVSRQRKRGRRSGGTGGSGSGSGAGGAGAAAGSPRERARQLLRRSGEAHEQGDAEAGRRLLEEAMAADPGFVEPALALAAEKGRIGDREGALAAVEEAVRRGRAQVARGARPGREPEWWHDPETRPLMKALVARGARLLALDRAGEAAEQWLEVLELEPEDDPLGAGLMAGEAWLMAGDPMAALAVQARLAESAVLAYGRGLALLRTGQRRPALVSLWLGLMLNAAIGRELAGSAPPPSAPAAGLVDPDEAEEYLARAGDLWTAAERDLLARLIADPELERAQAEMARHARALDEAETPAAEKTTLAAIESLLDAERLEARVADLDRRLQQAPPPRRLPLA